MVECKKCDKKCTCSGTSENYLVLMNGLTFILGIVIIAYAIYLLVEFGDLKEGISTFPILAPLVVGVILLFVSGLGIYGAKQRNKFILIIYIVIVLLITLFVFGSGVSLLVYGGYLDNVQGGEISGEIEADIVDFELAVFQKCCVDTGNAAPILQCPQAGVCFTDAENLAFFLDKIDEKVCIALENVDINGIPLVGVNSTGSCGGGSADNFVNGISQYLKDNIVTLGSVNLAVAVIMLLILLATCILIFSKKPSKEEKKEEDVKGAPIVSN
jgi:hypothetical protein